MIPKSKIEKRRKANKKVKCDGCNKLTRTRNLIQFKGKLLCRNCRNKLDTFRIQMSASNYIKNPFCKTLEQALSKIYEVKRHKDGSNKTYPLSVPICLIGKKVKLVLVEDE